MTTALANRTKLVEAMFEIVAERGLDRLSVREVSHRTALSIGAVQHHFPTKDAMLLAAFEESVRRTRSRLAGVRWGEDVRANVVAALSQLLPLDAPRAAETRVHLAFAARAAVDAELAAVQARTLRGVTDELGAALPVGRGALPPHRAAALLVAATDGLAMHAVSSGTAVNRRALLTALSAVVDAVVA